MHPLLDFVLLACVASIAFGAVRLVRAYRAHRVAQAFAAYRAASLVIESRRALRAGQHRAQEREWGRAA